MTVILRFHCTKTMSGMPNLRKNPSSTDLYRLFQSMIYGRIYRFVLTRFGYYPPPPPPLHFRDRGILREKTISGRIYGFSRTEFGYYPPPPDFRLDWATLPCTKCCRLDKRYTDHTLPCVADTHHPTSRCLNCTHA